MSFNTCSHCGKVRKKVDLKLLLLKNVIDLKDISKNISDIETELNHIKKSDEEQDLKKLNHALLHIINDTTKIINRLD